MANVIEKIRAFDGHITEIANLKAKVSEIESSSLKAAEIDSALVEATRVNDDMAKEILALKESAATAQTSLVELESKVATVDEQVESRASILAQQQLAAVGVPPVAVVPSEKPQGGATKMSRADFTKLSPTMQMSFIKSGGQLTE